MLRIFLFSDFRLYAGQQMLSTLSSARLQSLLAYLLLNRTAPQPRQHLSLLFWPDTSEQQARTNLRNLLYLLRQALPDAEQLLDVSATTVQWRSDAAFTLDVAEFEQTILQLEHSTTPGLRLELLARALELYSGDLLPKLYDEWLLSERERLRGLYLHTLEEIIGLCNSQEQYAAAIEHARRLLRADPLREETYRTLMQLHAANQDRASALHVFHTCVRVLERELEVEPSPTTRDLYTQLLQPLDIDVQTEAKLVPATSVQIPLIGRKGELRQLYDAWKVAIQGSACVVLLLGEAGIGKTRLAEELYDSVRTQGAVTARTQAYATVGMLAYASVVDWLRSDSLYARVRNLPDVWLTELTRLLPEISSEYPHLPRSEPLTQTWQRQRLFDALAHATVSEGEPLLLLFDDIHWSDQETLDWLHYLLISHRHAPILIVATVRSEAVDETHPLFTWRSTLLANRLIREIEISPFNLSETIALGASVAKQALSSTLGERLYAETEGYPLFVVEMMRAGFLRDQTKTELLGSDGSALVLPERVRSVVHARIAQLTPQARELMEVATVVGREFSFDVLARITKIEEESLVHRLDELWHRRIVREQGADAYDFTHDKIREVAYSGLSAGRRKLLHRQVADALLARHGPRSERMSGRLALHFEHGGMPEQAVHQYALAAKVAQNIYAHSEAIRHYESAIRLGQDLPPAASPSVDLAFLYEGLGDALQMTGQIEEARSALQAALEWPPSGEPIRRPSILRKIGKTWELQYEYEQARQFYRAAESALEPPSEPKDAAWQQVWIQIQLEQIWVCYWLNDWQEAVYLAEGVRSRLERVGSPEQRINYYQALAATYARRDRYVISPETLELVDQALSIALQLGDVGQIAWTRFVFGFLRLWQGELDDAERQIRQALELAVQRGDVVHQSRCLTYLTIVYRKRGAVQQVQLYAQQSLDAAMVAHTTEYQATAKANLAWCAWRKGDMHAAVQDAEAAIAVWEGLPHGHIVPLQWTARWPLLAMALRAGKTSAAVAQARTMVDTSQHLLPNALTARLEAVLTAWDCGQPDVAQSHLEVALAMAQKFSYL